LRVPRLVRVLACFALVPFLNACGDIHRAAEVRPPVPHMISTTTTTLYSPQDLAYFKALAASRWHTAVAKYQEQQRWLSLAKSAAGASSRTSSVPVSRTSSAAGGINWTCIAEAETGGDWTMHGSNYSTALGILNQAVRENATPEVAARVFAGTASRAEQIAIGESIVRKFGIRAWAPSTVRKCS
jgi:hypothetical protein